MIKVYKPVSILFIFFSLLFLSGCGNGKECGPKQIGKALNTILEEDIDFIYTINTITCSFPKENILRLQTTEEIDNYIETFKTIFSEIKPYNPQSKKIKRTFESFIKCFSKIKRSNTQIERLSKQKGKAIAEKRLKEMKDMKAKTFEDFNKTFTPELYKVKADYYQELKARVTSKLREYCHVSLIDPDKEGIEEIYKYAKPVWEKQKSAKIKSAEADQVCLNKADVFYKTFVRELIISIGDGI